MAAQHPVAVADERVQVERRAVVRQRTRAIRRGTQDSINRAGEQIVSRELNVRPTLTIRSGFPVRVLVTRDLVLGGEQ